MTKMTRKQITKTLRDANMADAMVELRNAFDFAVDSALALNNKAKATDLQLAREYFTNQKFRAELEEFVWQLNQ